MRFTISIVLIFCLKIAVGQNPLYIPPALTGTTFNLNVQAGTKVFYDTTMTPTFGINGVWLSPTIIVNKGDSITLNVKNGLNVKTTMHWHGLHVSAMNDGGPHQIIKPNTTWIPSFKVRNNAGTFWYHPHGAGQTDPQVSKGLAGLFIVKDNYEAALALPRTYGVDDIPIIIQSKAFDDLKQIAIATDMDTALFVNGTLRPLATLPAQVIRLRLLNGSSLRSYNLGLSNGQTFYQIATDGGLIDSPVALTRLRISPGERAEVLVNFAGMKGQKVELKSYSSEMASGIYGADTLGVGADTIHEYADNFLNGADFNLLQISIDSATANPLNAIPVSLVPYIPFNAVAASKFRTIVFDTIRLLPADAPNLAEGPFGMNNRTFEMDSINEVVHLGTTEVWTLVNKTLVAHPFHIHDIQFNVIEKSGVPPPPSERGWKDVVLVMPDDSVKFITRFETFADNMTPYMYHCHLLHHEDDGMMGGFLVVDTMVTSIGESSFENKFSIYPNPTLDELNITSINNEKFSVSIFNALGEKLSSRQVATSGRLSLANYSNGMYFLQVATDQGLYTQKIIKQ